MKKWLFIGMLYASLGGYAQQSAQDIASYQTALTNLNKFLYYFSGGDCGKFEVAGDTLIQRPGRYGDLGMNKAHVKDLSYAIIDTKTGDVKLPCKYGAYLIVHGDGRSNEDYFLFADRNRKVDYPELANLLNDLVFTLQKIPQGKRIVYNADGTIKQPYSYTETPSAVSQNATDTKKSLENLNDFLKTFNNSGEYQSASVKGDSIVISNNYTSYGFHIKDISGAVVNEKFKAVEILCKWGQICFSSSSSGANNASSFIFTTRGSNGMNIPFNYAELANLWNKFIYAMKKQAIPEQLVYKEEKQSPPIKKEQLAVKEPSTPLEKAIAGLNTFLKWKKFQKGEINNYESITLTPDGENLKILLDDNNKQSVILERVGNIYLKNVLSRNPELCIESDEKKGYCLINWEGGYYEKTSFNGLSNNDSKEAFRLWGKVIDEYRLSKNPKYKPDVSYQEKYESLMSPNFIENIPRGSTVRIDDVPKLPKSDGNADYFNRKAKNLEGTEVTCTYLDIDKNFMTYTGKVLVNDKEYPVRNVKLTFIKDPDGDGLEIAIAKLRDKAQRESLYETRTSIENTQALRIIGKVLDDSRSQSFDRYLVENKYEATIFDGAYKVYAVDIPNMPSHMKSAKLYVPTADKPRYLLLEIEAGYAPEYQKIFDIKKSGFPVTTFPEIETTTEGDTKKTVLYINGHGTVQLLERSGKPAQLAIFERKDFDKIGNANTLFLRSMAARKFNELKAWLDKRGLELTDAFNECEKYKFTAAMLVRKPCGLLKDYYSEFLSRGYELIRIYGSIMLPGDLDGLRKKMDEVEKAANILAGL